jgi:ubiquinone biosynthesis accessory factor UbiJ
MLTSIAVTPINHMLRGESWACKRLQSYSGKTICVQIPPLFEINMIVQADGEVQNTIKQGEMDATLSISPGMLPGLLAHDERVYARIKISGDTDFANELINISKNININSTIEQDLSKIIGDIPAHRIAQAGEQVIQWHADSINNLSQALVEYWMEEQPMLAKSAYINEFANEVKRLQDNVDQLDQRIQHLIQKAAL